MKKLMVSPLTNKIYLTEVKEDKKHKGLYIAQEKKKIIRMKQYEQFLNGL